MAKRKREEEAGYSYMDTYGDMVTLLLTFFILLFSMSTVDNDKWEILIKAFSNKDANTSQIIMIPVGDGSDYAPAAGEKGTMSDEGENDSPSLTASAENVESMEDLAKIIEEYLEQNNLQESVKMETEGKNAVYLTFDNNLFFDGDSYRLRQSSYDILGYLGGLFKAAENEIFMIRVNGHTAAIPGWDDYEVSDWDLSALRANSVIKYFEEAIHIAPIKLMANGWGKNHPVASNETEEGRAQNRRVDIQILGKDYASSSPEELLAILNRTLDVGLYDNTPVEQQPVEPPENLLTDESTPAEGVEGMEGTTEVMEPSESEPPPPAPVPANVDPDQIASAVEALEQASKT